MVIDEELGLSLEHHGIDGQKWGHRNGPPYPLDPNKDYSKEEKKKNKIKKKKKESKKEVVRKKRIKSKTKEEAIKSGKPRDVEKFLDEMSNNEIRESIERIRLYDEIKKMSISDITPSTSKNKNVKNIKNTIERETSSSLNIITKTIDTGLKISALKKLLKGGK